MGYIMLPEEWSITKILNSNNNGKPYIAKILYRGSFTPIDVSMDKITLKDKVQQNFTSVQEAEEWINTKLGEEK